MKQAKYYHGYTFRLYPNSSQQKQIEETFAYVRRAYNQGLHYQISYFSHHHTYAYASRLTKVYIRGRERWKYLDCLSNSVLSLLARNIENAVFALNGKNITDLKEKDINDYHSSYTFAISESEKAFISGKDHMTLPKIGRIKVKIHRKVAGKILRVTIRKEPDNRYYLSLNCVSETNPNSFDHGKKDIGVDVGVKELATDSTGAKYTYPSSIKDLDKKISLYHHRLSRKQKDSERYQKYRVKLASLYQKKERIIKEQLHLTANAILHRASMVAIESLDISAMLKNHCLAKSISNSAWYSLFTILKYKGKWNHITIVEVPRYFPSSQLCSYCGCKNEKIKDLHIRKWKCPKCGKILDRDINAAINIRNKGRKMLSE